MDANYNWTRYWAPQGKPIHQYGFLPDPEFPWGDKEIVTFEQIQHIPFLVLLGNPGIGKSTTVQKISERLNEQGKLCILRNFRDYNDFRDLKADLLKDGTFRKWRNSEETLYLFLDSLDEGRSLMRRLEHDIVRFLQKLPVRRLSIRITCRSAELPDDFLELMTSLLTTDQHSDKRNLIKIYQLTQLRESDVWHRAKDSGITADDFILSVRRAGVESFAASPITLNMLFGIYKNHGNLPADRSTVYREGCHFLARENSPSRRDDNLVGKFEVEERLKAARQIAALSIIGNHPRILSTAEPLYESDALNLRNCYLPEQDWATPEELLRETLQKTALFLPLKPQHYVWAHLSYGEFLAAEFVNKMEMQLKQIQNLFINPADPEQKIAPKLHETAAWLASMRQDVFDWILKTEPLILIHSDSVPLTSAQKATFIKHFVQVYAIDGFAEYRLDWNDQRHLNYPELGSQLRSYLEDKGLHIKARYQAADFVLACDISTIDDVLIALALDADEDYKLRKDALYALSRSKQYGNNISQLRSLIFQASEYKADIDLVVFAMDILWPKYLSAGELFERLHLPTSNHVEVENAYDRIFERNIVEQFGTNDLLIALDWVVKETPHRDHEISFAGRNFIIKIMQKAWSELGNEAIRLAFARAAWQRMIHFNPVITNEERSSRNQESQYAYTDELQQNTLKRRQLLEAMLNVLLPQEMNNEKLLLLLLRWGSHSLPFVTKDDVTWLIERAREDEGEVRRQAYAYLVDRLLSFEDTDLWSQIFDECESGQNPAITKYFKERFEAVPLDSTLAQEGRKRLAQHREFEAEQAKLEEKKLPLAHYVNEWLEACDTDSSKWWHLSHSLLANEFGRIDADQWDLRKGGGWHLIQDNQETVSNILYAALRYIKEQNPFIGNVEPSVPIMNRYPALEGYRALILLSIYQRLHQLTVDDWRRWAEVVVFNVFQKETEVSEIDDFLLQKSFETATDALLARLQETIEQSDHESYLYSLLLRFKYAARDQLEHLLLDLLFKTNLKHEKFYTLLSYLLKASISVSQASQKVAVSYLTGLPNDEKEQQTQNRIINVLANNAQNGEWWPTVWKLLIADKGFATSIFNVIGDWHSSPYLRFLAEEELSSLYLRAVEIYPFAEDIDFHSGAVPGRYIRQEWREGILKEISGRGTLESVEILKELYEKMPQKSTIGYLLQQAKERFRLESWIAPNPSDILKLAVNSQRQYVRNADQLFELIVDTLLEIETDFHANAPEQRKIWDKQAQPKETFRPVEEEAFSDAIADWLRRRLKNAVVNREVEVRQSTEKPRGERTDIIVETIRDMEETLMVIIEVKGSWYEQIYERIQTQLVNEYLAKHDRCSHGLYLVGYFVSDRWDKSDRRYKTAVKRTKSKLDIELKKRVAALDKPRPMTVETLIFDASI